MRRYFGIILTVVIALAVLIGLNAVESLSVERQPENESNPRRSSYNPGPTGTRAFYQWLEESGYRVARWRENYQALQQKAQNATLVVIGPFQFGLPLNEAEAQALREWIARGGHLLLISRTPQDQFGDKSISVKYPSFVAGAQTPPEQLVDQHSDLLIAQPTELTRQIRGLAVSRLATRLRFQPPPESASQRVQGESNSVEDEERADETSTVAPRVQAVALTAPVIHLGDNEGAVLADFDYGSGRVVFLSDPFVIANNGIARGANLTLALNLIQALGGRERLIYFDEYHHGYQSESNPLVSYFRGTPVPWLFAQSLILTALIFYSQGRRFARPLPLPRVDRHSPLEFVGSMANLEQLAQARDLAIETIYPRFKAQLCRALGVSVRARPEEIVAGLNRRKLKVAEIELYQTLSGCERILAGEAIDDYRLLSLVSTMRRISAQLR
jgi:hypothetical protein